MKDIEIGETFDVVIDDRMDLGVVDGQEEFEQYLAHALTAFYYDDIGAVDKANITNRLQLEARRIVISSDRVDSLQNIVVEFSDEDPNVVEVSIIYASDEISTFNIN